MITIQIRNKNGRDKYKKINLQNFTDVSKLRARGKTNARMGSVVDGIVVL